MNKLLIILVLCLLFVKASFSQTTANYTQSLNWSGIEKWNTNSNSIEVLSFQGATFPKENHLPYFTKRVICESGFNYITHLKNTIYVPLSPDEVKLLEGSQLSSEALLEDEILTISGMKQLEIQVLPFANVSGKLVKLSSFELEVTKTKAPLKSSASTLHSYANASVLANGHFVKIGIAETGVYKLSYENLVAWGINPQNVHIFGYGGGVLEQSFLLPKIDDLPELAIYVEKGVDGVFGPGDYVLFYGQGIVKWSYDATKLMFTHTDNPYSQVGYYFISSDAVATAGKSITIQSAIVPPDTAVIDTVTEFIDYKVSEKDLRSLPKAGKEFYGDAFSSTLSYNYILNFPNIVSTASTLVRLDVAATSSVTSNFVLKLNDTQSKTLSVAAKSSDVYQLAMAAGSTIVYTFTPLIDSMSFSVTYNKPNTGSIGYMNFLEVNARRLLKMSGSVMQFQNTDWLGKGFYNYYVISNANANVQVWDITNPLAVSRVSTTLVGTDLSFIASSNVLAQYIAIDTKASSSFLAPLSETVVANQNLHALQQADMVILTHPDFITQAQTLAQAHRLKDNLTVEVVTTEQVYNEFSSGTPDATAYRWVMKMLYDRASNSTNQPKYLLLMGRGTYDNKKLNVEPESGDNLILTYQADNSLSMTNSYVTDDYFTFLDDNEGTNIPAHSMDISVGRFPVTTVQQASDVVNKTIAYMNNTQKGVWKNQICFLADDGDAALHMRQADSTASSLARNFPSFQVNKIYLDAFLQEVSASGPSYPLARTKFQSLMKSGLLMLNYTGHASPAGWTNNQILSTNDVITMANPKLPFWWAATCDFMQFDIKSVSGGEDVVLNPISGGIGIVSAARAVYASQNVLLNRYFSDNIYKKVNGIQQRVGDVIAAAKNQVGTQVNKLPYIYMGDPALMLNYPTTYQVITKSINGGPLLGNDTLRSLAVTAVSGVIATQSGDLVSNFNGTLHATVYDKSQRITTLNNNNDGALIYSDRPNILFSGDAIVKNGVFSFNFLLPRDTKYNFGTGRINYYAQDSSSVAEAQGYFENFVVGGINSNFVPDSVGPNVQMFLNDSLSTSYQVNNSPVFVANISDVDGINSFSSGIGHEVLLVLDQDPNQSYVLNDNFQFLPNSYTSARVKIQLPTMLVGKHTLTFRVWDLLNNSTSKSLDFEVVNSLAPVVFSVANYPNPVVGSTRFLVKNENPESVVSTSIVVHDLAGRKLWTSPQQNNSEQITWNLIADDGQKIKPGVYLYRVNVKTKQNDIFTKTNKMLIVAP